MSDESSRRVGLKGTREPSFANIGDLDQGASEIYEFGQFRLDPAERKLSRNEEPVVLTPKAFDTLVILVRNSGHLLEKDELIRTLWPDSFVEEGNLSNNVFVLRKALGEDHQYIETIPKRGYRFVGAVRQLPSPSARLKEKPQLELASPATQGAASGLNLPAPSTLSTPLTVSAFLPWRKLAAWFSAGAVCTALGTFAYLKSVQPRPVQPLAAVPLTALPGWADFPAISPDGSRVVFEWTGEQQFAAFDLYVKTIGNENLLRLTNDPATHLAPTWSPDGSQIAFQRIAKDRGGIYVVPASGGAVRKLRSTNASFDASMHINWSPDGKAIAFADSPFPGGHKRLQLLSLETLQSTPIEHNDKCVEELWPAFSPDGTLLAYACALASREGEFGLSVATADGHASRIIKESSGWLRGLGWKADGKTLIFTENHTGEDHAILRELNIENGLCSRSNVQCRQRLFRRFFRRGWSPSLRGKFRPRPPQPVALRPRTSQCAACKVDFHHARSVLPAVFARWKAHRLQFQSRRSSGDMDERSGGPKHRAIDGSERPSNGQPGLVAGQP
jgi:DNA-binding winged helix-turn-helix (wHTH) protein